MMEYARVSVHTVEQFMAEVNTVLSLTSNLSGCESTMTELISFLDDLVKNCESSLQELQDALAYAKEKKEEYDALVNQLTAEKADIVSELNSIRSELATTPKYYTETDSDGLTHKVRNPEYDDLKDQEYEAQQRLNDVNQRLSDAKAKLESAKSVIYKVTSHIKEVSSAHKQLCESKDRSRKIQATFSEVRTDTNQQASSALEILSKILTICRSYLGQQIKKEALNPAYSKQSNSSTAYTSQVPGKFSDATSQSNLQNNEDQSQKATQQTDDNGQVYRVNNELVKNAEFQINGYTYKTDSNCRTVQASGKLKIPVKHDRNMESMNVVGKGDQLASDDRGHLIGHQFFGSDRLENLVPQAQKINQGSYARLETHLAGLVNTGKEVYVSVTPFYKDTRRPEAIFYYYSVDGHSSAVFFSNSLPEEIA